MLGIRNPAKLAQAAQDFQLAALGGLGVDEGIVAAGGLGEAGDEGGLGQREALHVLAEVGARRGLDPVAAGAEVDEVEIEREYLLLGAAPLQLGRQQGLLHLAHVAAL